MRETRFWILSARDFYFFLFLAGFVETLGENTGTQTPGAHSLENEGRRFFHVFPFLIIHFFFFFIRPKTGLLTSS